MQKYVRQRWQDFAFTPSLILSKDTKECDAKFLVYFEKWRGLHTREAKITRKHGRKGMTGQNGARNMTCPRDFPFCATEPVYGAGQLTSGRGSNEATGMWEHVRMAMTSGVFLWGYEIKISTMVFWLVTKTVWTSRSIPTFGRKLPPPSTYEMTRRDCPIDIKSLLFSEQRRISARGRTWSLPHLHELAHLQWPESQYSDNERGTFFCCLLTRLHSTGFVLPREQSSTLFYLTSVYQVM